MEKNLYILLFWANRCSLQECIILRVLGMRPSVVLSDLYNKLIQTS